MRKNIFILTVALAACLASCKSSDSERARFAARSKFPENQSSELYKMLQPESQHFELKADVDTVIRASGGSKVFIPQNSFVDADGIPVKGNLKIEIIEALTVSDLIKLNLQTVSEGKILQTEGMIYIDATADGKQVFLPENKSLQIDLPNVSKTSTVPAKSSNANAAPVSIFRGQYDETGKLNWVKTGEKENKLIPFPVEYLNLNWDDAHFFVQNLKRKRDSVLLVNHGDTSVLHSNFATVELEDRLKVCMWVASQEVYAYHTYKTYFGGDANINDTFYKQHKVYAAPLFSAYLNNIRKPLWYSDSIAYELIKMKVEGIKKNKSEFYEKEADYFNRTLSCAKSNYDAKLNNVIILDYSGIDLSKSSARVKLAKLGKTSVEIDEILGANKRREAIIAAIIKERKADEDYLESVKINEAAFSNSFSVNHIGWINCDRYYDNPKAKEAKLTAHVANMKDFEFVSMIMVIDSEKVALNAQMLDKGQYSFTGTDAPYTKLPIGQKAIIVAMSNKGNKLYYAVKPIIIAEKADFAIELKEGSKQELDNKIGAIK